MTQSDFESYSTNPPKATLVIPFFQTGSYLTAAIDSALESKYVDLEILLIDDGSTDNGSEIARVFADNHQNIRLISLNQNRGVYFARNLALLESTGDFIAFLDSDDIQDPLRLISQIKVLQKFDGDICLCLWSRWLGDFETPVSKARPAMISMLFHKSLIDQVGFFHTTRWGADREFLRRVEKIAGVKKVVVLQEDLIKSRLRNDSLTMQAGSEFYVYSKLKKELIVRPSSFRMLYRDHYEQMHAKTNHKDELRQEFPFVSENLTAVHGSQAALSLDPRELVLLIAGLSNMPMNSQLAVTLDYLAKHLPQVQVMELTEENLKNHNQLGLITCLSAITELKMADLRKLLAYTLDAPSNSSVMGKYVDSDLEISFHQTQLGNVEIIAELQQNQHLAICLKGPKEAM
jgi:glycosyltransferase involved in cell wall biosynthesis